MVSQELHLGGTEANLLGATPDHPVQRMKAESLSCQQGNACQSTQVTAESP
jgi:hypothetical protein